jgi:hypothetical protein
MPETEESSSWPAADGATFLQALQKAPSAEVKRARDGAAWFTLHTIYIPHTRLYYGLTAVLRRKHLRWYCHAGRVNPRRAKYAMRTATRYWKALRRRQVSHPQETKRFLDLILPPRSHAQTPRI